MKTPVDEDFIRGVANVVHEKEFVIHLFSMLDTEELRRGMLEYVAENDNLDKEALLIKAIDLCGDAGRLGTYK